MARNGTPSLTMSDDGFLRVWLITDFGAIELPEVSHENLDYTNPRLKVERIWPAKE